MIIYFNNLGRPLPRHRLGGSGIAVFPNPL